MTSLGLLMLGQVWSWLQVWWAMGCFAAAMVGWPGVTYDPAGNTNSQQDLLFAYHALLGFCWTNLKLHTADG